MILRSRFVVPVSGPPIHDGAIVVSEGRILALGSWPDIAAGTGPGPMVDLGETIVLPGLVNAHCHLDYTGLVGMLAPPRNFPDWIKSILAAKAGFSDADFTTSWHTGAVQLVTSGTTTVANIETMPAGLAERRAATPLRLHSFLELTGVRQQRDPVSLVAEAIATLDRCRSGPGAVGLSPHAPYSTLPALFREAAQAARKRGWKLTTHLAESLAEFEMFMFRRGPMFDWLHGQRPCEDCGLGSPIQHAAVHGLLGPDLLAVHVNYLWDEDAALLGRTGASVVHCPRSHDYFHHQHFPSDPLIAAGVNLCLGTDSLASVRTEPGRRSTLSLFDEMAMLAARDNTLAPETILRWATVHGARALGLEGMIGQLSPGAHADLIVLPAPAGIGLVAEEILHHQGPVLASMIGGNWVWHRPGYEPAGLVLT